MVELWALLVTLPGFQRDGDRTVGMSCDLGQGSTCSLQPAEICLTLLKYLEQDFVSFG